MHHHLLHRWKGHLYPSVDEVLLSWSDQRVSRMLNLDLLEWDALLKRITLPPAAFYNSRD